MTLDSVTSQLFFHFSKYAILFEIYRRLNFYTKYHSNFKGRLHEISFRGRMNLFLKLYPQAPEMKCCFWRSKENKFPYGLGKSFAYYSGTSN